MGRSGAEGFGCDITDGPSTRVAPDVVLLPDTVDDPTDPFAWLAYDGRWGERHADPNNGPTGPAGKDRWTAPVDWQDDLRDSAFVVPTGDSQATQVIDTFCSVVEWGSVKFIEFQSSPTRVLISIGIVALFARFLIRRTSWNGVEPVPVVGRRRAGQIARASLVLYGRHPVTFAAIGVLNVPLVVLSGLIASLIRHAPLVGNDVLTGSETGDGGTRLVMSLLISGLTSAAAFVVAAAAVAWIVDQSARGRRVTAIDAVRAIWSRARDLVRGFARAAVIVLVLSISVIGIPFAIRQLVRYQFMPHAVMLEALDGRRSLERSSDLVRKRWWHTALFVGIVYAILGGVGLVFGLALLVVFTGMPLWTLSLIVTMCNVFVMPLAAIAVTMLYGDAVAEQADRADVVRVAELAGSDA
jgi:hypothetical protein